MEQPYQRSRCLRTGRPKNGESMSLDALSMPPCMFLRERSWHEALGREEGGPLPLQGVQGRGLVGTGAAAGHMSLSVTLASGMLAPHSCVCSTGCLARPGPLLRPASPAGLAGGDPPPRMAAAIAAAPRALCVGVCAGFSPFAAPRPPAQQAQRPPLLHKSPEKHPVF
jgi:hypothetical protein